MAHIRQDVPVPSAQDLLGPPDAWPDPTPAHRHAYADLIRGDGRWKAADMHRVVEVMYRLFGTLRDCRLVIAANTRDEGIRVALVADAHEEYGRGDAARSRAFQMRQVLQSLGYTELTPIHLGPKGEDVLDRKSVV